MSDANQANTMELKNIFNLFEPNSQNEIDIKQINSFLKNLDNLQINAKKEQMQQQQQQKDNKQEDKKQQQQQSLTKKSLKEESKQQLLQQQQQPTVVGGGGGGQSNNFLQVISQQQQNGSLTKNSSTTDNTLDEKKKEGSGDKLDDNSFLSDKNEFIQVMELKYFPTNKSTMNFNEFVEMYNECMSSKELQEELLYSCFNTFDYSNDGIIDSKKIKNIFEIFKDKTNIDEIHNVLKFCGVSNDKMNYNEFKEFFKKNF